MNARNQAMKSITLLLSLLWASACTSQPAGPQSYEEAREAMVRSQLTSTMFGRKPVRDERVLDAMRTVPRHEFVPAGLRSEAYSDTPLPIGHDQTISQPYIVAVMTEALEPEPDDIVLEVGTGSGYQAAVLAEIVADVYTIEIVEPLGRRAAADLERLGYDNVHARIGDGYKGWPEHAPFDGIVVTAAPDHVPEPLIEQLKPGGRMVIPVGPTGGIQQLRLIRKTEDGAIKDTILDSVRFVPLTRDDEP